MGWAERSNRRNRERLRAALEVQAAQIRARREAEAAETARRPATLASRPGLVARVRSWIGV